MKYILLICSFSFFNTLNAQTEFTYFNKTFWNDSMNILSPIAKPVDDDYITFGTYGTATMTSYVYMRKTDKHGNTLWIKNLDSETDGDIGAVIWGGQSFIKNDTEIYLTYSKDLFDGQKRDVNLLKLDTAGNIIWKRTYGSDRHEFAQYMIPTLDGGTALAGVRWWETDTASQMYIAKVDLFGTLQWEKTYAPNWGEAFSIQETWWDGGYIVGGFSLTDSLNLLYDMHILKLDWQGEVEWEKTYGWIGYDLYAYVIPATTPENFISTDKVEYHLFSFYDKEIFENVPMMARLDASGEMIWERTYPEIERCIEFQTFPVIKNDKVLVNALQFNNYARPDNLLIEFDATNGDINWTKPLSFSPADDVYFKDLEPTKDGGYVLGGYQYAATPQKSWIVKIDSLGNTCQQYDCDSTVLLDTSVGDLSFVMKEKTIKISPNPATSTTQVNFSQAAQKLRIYTATGILISEYELTESDRQKTLKLENFAKGIYLVELVYRDNNTQVEKLAVID